MNGLFIGAVAKMTGVPPPTIRYYEAIGLLAPPRRSSSGYRCYSEATVDELRFVRKAQAFGFSLEEIAEVLRLSRAGQAPCAHVLTLAHRHLAAVEDRIRLLQAFRGRLAVALAKWEDSPPPSGSGLCRIIAEAGSDDGVGEPEPGSQEPG
ncbi:MAG: heavy metal-responsive transcriptional regulator [Vicinamibacterales bacterium]|nr:heavy metal-responsive transcriptional regulator [Vicinamibacterales bacterium]